MKSKELIKRFKKGGWWFLRHGGDHDIYTNGTDTVAIPRHNEIRENLAKGLLRQWGL